MAMTRSQIMARIRGRDTKPELRLRRALWRAGLRYRVNFAKLAGRPDVVFAGARVAVFVDGCQWHGCPEHYVRPRTRTAFWSGKLRSNVERDVRQTAELESAGWRVLRFWEHDVDTVLDAVVNTVVCALHEPEPVFPAHWCVVEVEPVDEAGNLERRHLIDLRSPEHTHVVERRRLTTKRKKR